MYPSAHREAQRLQEKVHKTLTEAEALKLQAGLEDLTVWEMEKVKESKKAYKEMLLCYMGVVENK